MIVTIDVDDAIVLDMYNKHCKAQTSCVECKIKATLTNNCYEKYKADILPLELSAMLSIKEK